MNLDPIPKRIPHKEPLPGSRSPILGLHASIPQPIPHPIDIIAFNSKVPLPVWPPLVFFHG